MTTTDYLATGIVLMGLSLGFLMAILGVLVFGLRRH